MAYNHLRGRGFKEGNSGINVYSVPITIDLVANQDRYQFEEKSRLERNYTIGVWGVNAGTETSLTKTVAAQAILDSAYINIRQDQETIIEKLYLSNILKANAEGKPYELNIDGPINLSESELVVNDPANIVADTVIELVFDYAKKAR